MIRRRSYRTSDCRDEAIPDGTSYPPSDEGVGANDRRASLDECPLPLIFSNKLERPNLLRRFGSVNEERIPPLPSARERELVNPSRRRDYTSDPEVLSYFHYLVEENVH